MMDATQTARYTPGSDLLDQLRQRAQEVRGDGWLTASEYIEAALAANAAFTQATGMDISTWSTDHCTYSDEVVDAALKAVAW